MRGSCVLGLRARAAGVFAVLLAACVPTGAGLGSPRAPGGDRGGKPDDFFSEEAFEFVVEGRTRLVLEEDYGERSGEERLARVRELIGLKHLAHAYFLTQYLIEKDDKEKNHGFGGFGGMAKTGSYEQLDIEEVAPLTFEFTFRQIVAGRGDLLARLPVEQGEDGARYVTVRMGLPSNAELAELETDEEWFRREPWKDWPAYSTPETPEESMRLRIFEDEATPDAWLDFPRLLADGVLRIDVHFGWDYYSEYHRKHARQTYLWLKNEEHYVSPVTSFDELRRSSGPFTRTLLVPRLPEFDAWCTGTGDACAAEVQVRLFYGKSGTNTDPQTAAGARQLERDLYTSLREADVMHFSGHAGPFYGFSMADWKTVTTSDGDISYHELELAEMPDDRYQIVVADGCDTYQTAQAFAANPHKPGGRNVDVITTTSYSSADLPYSVMNMISHLTETDATGLHRPRSVRALMRDLQDANWGNPMYGIHFVADNPHVHPYADDTWSCEPCDEHRECGAAGNRCVAGEKGDGYCAAVCSATDACPEGYVCGSIAAPNAVYPLGCVPASLDCDE